MIKRTIAHREVWIGKIGLIYIIVCGREIEISLDEPVTDQDLERYEKELREIRELLNLNRLF